MDRDYTFVNPSGMSVVDYIITTPVIMQLLILDYNLNLKKKSLAIHLYIVIMKTNCLRNSS